MVKNLPAMWETWVHFLDQEDPLEKGLITHCSILARRIPWTEEPGGLPTMGSKNWTQLSDSHNNVDQKLVVRMVLKYYLNVHACIHTCVDI